MKTILFALFATCVFSAVAGSRLYPTDINVRDFGARGDGVADDTAALQAASDAASARAEKVRRGVGGRNCERNSQMDGPMPRLVFPAGVYRVTGPVVFQRDHQIYALGEVTVQAASDDIDIFVFHSTMRQFVSGFRMEGGARQFLIETYNNESANFTARDCTFVRATRTAIDSHSWKLMGGAGGKGVIKVGTYMKDKGTGRWKKDPRRDSPDLKGYNNSTLLTLERCRFEDCQIATDVNSDGAIFREIEASTSVSTSCVFRVANNLHAYNLDVKVRRPNCAPQLAVFDYRSAHGFLLEHSRFQSMDGKGVALVRTGLTKGAYISNTLILRALEVACGGCPEGGIVICPNRKTAEFISVTDVTDTTGRKVRAVVYPDGIAAEDYDDFRYFSGFSSDLTYSVVLGRNSDNVDESLPLATERFRESGELAPDPVSPLKVPRLAHDGEILWGPDYGVGITAGTNDTAAMKRLFAVAETKPGSTVVLPPRRIVLDETVAVAGSFNVTAAGVAMVEASNDSVTLFRVADGAAVAFSHVFFEGGSHQVVCSAERGATIVIDSCMTFDSERAAFEMVSRGGPNRIRFLLNGGVHYHPVWYVGNAHAIMSGAWFRSLPPKSYKETFNESCAVVNCGKMRYQDILGVPCVFAWHPHSGHDDLIPSGDYRWIDNRGGELHSLFSRFGGEWGGIPLVYNYNGGKVLLEGSYAYFYPKYTAHQPIVTDGVPADLRMFGISCGFEVQMWYGGLKFLRRTPTGELEPIPDLKIRGNVPRQPPTK